MLFINPFAYHSDSYLSIRLSTHLFFFIEILSFIVPFFRRYHLKRCTMEARENWLFKEILFVLLAKEKGVKR